MKAEKQPEVNKILLVGGDQDQWQTYQSAFNNRIPDWKVTVEGCTRVEAALEKLEAGVFTFDILLVEDQLPGMSGLSLCKELQDRKFQLPIMILLEEDRKTKTENRVVEALEIGVHDYIIKDRKQYYLNQLPMVVRKVILNFKNCVFRKRAEAALRETEEKFLKAFMLSPNAMVITTLNEGRIIEANEAAVKETGFSREEMIGKTSMQLGMIKPEDREAIKRVLMEKGFYRNLEMKLYTRFGEEHICLLSGQTITLGGEACIIQAATDITRHKKMQEELLKSKNLESIGMLAGGIARDFNNYLTSIMGNISIAKMSLHNTKKIHRSLSRAEEASVKAADLASKLLTFSEGGVPINKKNSIIDIIRNTIDCHFKDSPVTFNHRYGSNIWPVSGDETQLNQLVHNIMLNAVQAMPNQGEVMIEIENVFLPQRNEFSLTKGNYVKISIKDTGVGIPGHHMDKIFDPFFSTQDTMNQPGLGLGLTISQSIIKKHQGAIAVDSREGKGTMVTMVIPTYSEQSS